MKVKFSFILIGLIVLLLGAGLFLSNKRINIYPFLYANSKPTVDSTVKFVSSTITADGVVTAQNKANLNFQIPGKLVYLPLKEGDKVYQGQTVASLDSYTIKEQLRAALNNYRITRNGFDQTNDNVKDNLANAQQVYPYNAYAVAGIAGGATSAAVNNAVARIADNSQAGLDNAVVNVELANYAFQLASLTSPLNGIITHEDVTVPGVNVTPMTTFVVADPSTMVFRANVPTESIYYVNEGGMVTMAIDGIQDKINGTVSRIYPSKVVLPSGQAVYQIDIVSDQLKKLAKLDMSGRAIIYTNAENVALVPAWTVLSGKYIWIDENGTPNLKKVTVGKIHGSEIEITGGLSAGDQIIIDPKYIPSLKYQLL